MAMGMPDRTQSDTPDREQKEMALLHLQRLHTEIAEAKSRANARAGPLLRGFLAGFLAMVAVAAVDVTVLGPSSSRDPSPVRGLLGIIALVGTWIPVTIYYRRRAMARSAACVEAVQQKLEAIARDISQRMAEWTDGMGGVDVFLDPARVGDALAILRGERAPSERVIVITLPQR